MPTEPSTDNPLNSGYDLLYTNGGTRSHVVSFDRPGKALCGLTPRRWPGTWFGVATRHEYDFAGKLPGCKFCHEMKHPEFARRKWVD